MSPVHTNCLISTKTTLIKRILKLLLDTSHTALNAFITMNTPSFRVSLIGGLMLQADDN